MQLSASWVTGQNGPVLTPNKTRTWSAMLFQATIIYTVYPSSSPATHTCILPSNLPFSSFLQLAVPSNTGSRLQTSQRKQCQNQHRCSTFQEKGIYPSHGKELGSLITVTFQLHHKQSQWHPGIFVCNGLCMLRCRCWDINCGNVRALCRPAEKQPLSSCSLDS